MNKMVIFDLDGTLLNDAKEVTPGNQIYVILLTMHLKPTDYQKEV